MDKSKNAVEGGETLVKPSNQSNGNLNNINEEIESISREIKNLTIETQNAKDIDDLKSFQAIKNTTTDTSTEAEESSAAPIFK